MTNRAILRSIEEGERLKGHRNEIRTLLTEKPKSIIILDDDPTGTQTVHDIPVITEWSEVALERELLASPVFFILTNSRSLQAEEADALAQLIGKRLKKLSDRHQKNLLLISRSDSTLRGHYPNEVIALSKGLGIENAKHLLAPAFFEGGRYTVDDIHYVQEGNNFVPAAETPFAKDNTFGYTASNLKDWIIEKTSGNVSSDKIDSLSIESLRSSSIAKIKSILKKKETSHLVVNATSPADLEAVALASIDCETPLVFRTAASFVNAISGIAPSPLLGKEKLLNGQKSNGALVVVGSYVPKTSKQLKYLEENNEAVFLELDVLKILETTAFQRETKKLSAKIDSLLGSKHNVVLYTSRIVIKGETKAKSLEIVNQVSKALIIIVEQLTVRPRYMLAKGGITSSDLATKALSVQRALIMGQVINGVPVWQLGKEAKYPNMPYIVFPGNVGDESALHNLIQKLE